MKKEELFEIIGDVDDELLKRENKQKRIPVWAKLVASAACVALAAVLTIPFFIGKGEKIELPKTTDNVKVYHMNELPSAAVSSEYSFAYNYTPEEIFAKQTDIYMGEILHLSTIMIDYDGKHEYRSIAEIKVNRVYRGELSEGDTVKLLLPWGFYFSKENFHTSVTKVIEQMEEGMTGIFMTSPYDETDYSETNNARLMLKDIADHGIMDGERWCFLETENGVAMGDMWTYEENNALDADATLTDVEDYILQMIRTK